MARLGEFEPTARQSNGSRDLLDGPDRRICVVTCLAALPLLAVCVRLADLQRDVPAVSFGEARAVRSVVEPIPARDGRILSADGKVLAEDVETFSLRLHYRWLERPVNPDWLRSEALKQLSPRERRDVEAVRQAEQRVEERREKLWTELSALTRIERGELLERFVTIQSDVEALRRTVVEARERKAAERIDAPSSNAAMWWEVAYESLRRAVTTPPGKKAEEPLILAEEVALHEIALDQPLSVAAAIEADTERFPATDVRVMSRRRYPYGSVAAHLVGYRFEDSDAGSSEESMFVRTGQTGIERSYDRHLQGIDGERRIWLNRQGEPVRTDVVKAPRVGRDLVLNLDFDLQVTAEKILDASLNAFRKAATPEQPVPPDAGGCIAVIDVRNGALLVAASAPRFDLSRAAAREGKFWRDATSDPRRPLFDRVAAAALPPGSVFKSVSAVALLEAGAIDPDAPFECQGYLSRKDQHRDYIYTHFGVGHGPTTLTSAIAESCNVYFFEGARRVGSGPLLRAAKLLGYGERTGIDVPGEAAGGLPALSRDTDTLGLAIGQASLLATPLQVVRMTAAIANGGRLVTPHAVRGSGPSRAGEATVRPILKTVQLDGFRSDTLARIREGLARTVSHPRGTGYKSVRHSHVAIAGKTGTAEVGGGLADHAWFAGYVPVDDPQFAIVVMLEHAGSGSSAAGPAAKQMIDAMLKSGLIRR